VADLDLAGTRDLDQAVQRLRRMADTLGARLQAAAERAAEPVIDAARANARRVLPRRGGYAAEVAASRMEVRPLRGGGVRIRVVGRDARLDKQGRLRHPTYGHEPWVGQQVTPGWFSVPARGQQRTVQRILEKALQRAAEEAG
jgi:hypothetical protein